MKELILTFALIILTLGLILSVKYLIYCSKKHTPARPKADIILYFNDEAMFELSFQRLVSSKAYSEFCVNLCVVDLVSTDKSRKWLETLSRKTDISFAIIEK